MITLLGPARRSGVRSPASLLEVPATHSGASPLKRMQTHGHSKARGVTGGMQWPELCH